MSILNWSDKLKTPKNYVVIDSKLIFVRFNLNESNCKLLFLRCSSKDNKGRLDKYKICLYLFRGTGTRLSMDLRPR